MAERNRMTDKVKFAHMKIDLGTNKSGYITVAYQEDEETATYGAAFCSPTDQFNKAKGRMIAQGRLLSRKRINIVDQVEDITTIERIFRDLECGNYLTKPWANTSIPTPRWFFE